MLAMRFRRSLLVLLALPASLALTACGGASTDRPKTASVKPDNMPEGGSWTGVFYDAQFGMLHLVHHGSNVTGRWKRPNGAAWGELNGPVVGNVAHFEWTEHKVGLVGPSSITKGKGYFVYVHPEGENVDDELRGEWGLGANETGSPWNCVKQRNVTPEIDSIGGAVEPGGPKGDWQ